jgi:hypothetical protein
MAHGAASFTLAASGGSACESMRFIQTAVNRLRPEKHTLFISEENGRPEILQTIQCNVKPALAAELVPTFKTLF